MNVTPNQAKKMMQGELTRLSLPFTKLAAKTVDFNDLARGSCIFVTVYGSKNDPKWEEAETFAKTNGFRVMVYGSL